MLAITDNIDVALYTEKLMLHIRWIKNHYKSILLWLVLIAIAPVFMEVLFFANIMGAEVAFGFFLLLIKDIYQNWRYRVQQLRSSLICAFKIIQNHPMCQLNIYFFHVSLSFIALFFCGSIAYSILIWYPIVMSGSVA